MVQFDAGSAVFGMPLVIPESVVVVKVCMFLFLKIVLISAWWFAASSFIYTRLRVVRQGIGALFSRFGMKCCMSPNAFFGAVWWCVVSIDAGIVA